MNRLFLFLTMLLVATNAAKGENYLNYPVNQDGQLRYSYTIVGSDSIKSKELAYNIALAALKSDMKLNYAPHLDTTLVDLVFHLSDDSLTSNGFSQRVSSSKKIAGSVLDFVAKKFYSGQPPTYSTVYRANDGIYTEYRIPTAIALPSGRILAFIEARSSNHDQAENDMVVKYSDDKGRSWSDLIVIDQQGEASLNNPCVTYIPQTQQVMLMYQCFPPKITEGNAINAEDKTSAIRCYVVFSGDGGESWTAPRDITEQVKPSGVASYCSGPGIAIVVASGSDKGRILVPFNVNGGDMWYNYLAYSDDHGVSWNISATHSGYGTNESQVVQLSDNKFLVNARSHRFMEGRGRVAPEGWSPWNFRNVTRNRAHMYVTMGGDNFEWSETEVREDEPDPTCQGSILRIAGDRSQILLANPANQRTGNAPTRVYNGTPPARINGEVKISYDSTKSWSYKKRIYGDRFTEYQYSVLVDLGDGEVGCFFEASPEVKFARFDLEWLTEGGGA